jgi:plastocyanin
LTAENIKFVEKSLQGKSGVISLYVVNKDSSFHTFDITVDGKKYSYPLAAKSTTGVVLKLGSGKYTYWCAVGDHRQNGMEGTIQTS